LRVYRQCKAIAESCGTALGALEPELYPHTVLLKSEATHLYAPVSSRFGGGAAHSNHAELSPSGQEREPASNQTRRVRAQGLCAHGRSSTHRVHYCRARLPGSPLVTQCGRRLACSPPFTLEKEVEIEHHLPLPHLVDGTGQLMGKHRQRLALPMFFLQAGQRLLAGRSVAEEEDRRFGQGPLQIRMADLRASGAIPLPRRFLGAFDQAAIGHHILDPRETGDIMALVEQDQTQKLANAGDGLEPVQGLGVVLLRCPHDGQCEIAESLVIEVKQGQVDFHAFGHRGIGKPLGDAGAVGFVGDLLPNLGQVVLPVGLLDMGQECRAFARQMQAAPEEITSRPPRGRLDVGLRAHAATE
jgi:hypothetical protein